MQGLADRGRGTAILIAVAGALMLPVEFASATTFAVTKTADTQDGTCDADCSLREAVIAANSNPGPDVIQLAVGTYQLTITGKDEDGSLTGDLDVTDDLVIEGAGAGSTIVDGGAPGDPPGWWSQGCEEAYPQSHADRILHVLAGTVEVRSLTLRGGCLGDRDPPGSGLDPEFGGGVRLEAGALVVRDSVISENVINGGGGGIGVDEDADLNLERSTVSMNSFGGIESYGDLTVVDSVVDANEATGIIQVFGTFVISRSAVTNTVAHLVGAGGGVGFACAYGSGVIENSTISGNATADCPPLLCGDDVLEGAVTAWEADLVVRSSTIADNPGPEQETGIGVGQAAEVVVETSIVRGACDLAVPLTSGGGNAEGPGDTCGFDPANDQVGVADLGLATLGDHGGPTPTHALQAGSPALDGGAAGPCPAVDQRGEPRVDGFCDVGAYEAQACIDTDGDGYGLLGSAHCTYPGVDCDDSDPAVNPGVTEIPENGIDDDCDESTPSGCKGQTIALDSTGRIRGGDISLLMIPLALLLLRRRSPRG